MSQIKPTINYKKMIHELCDKLEGKGIEPKIKVVLSLLPEIKSTSTAHKYIASWKANKAPVQNELLDNKLNFSSKIAQTLIDELAQKEKELELNYLKEIDEANHQLSLADKQLIEAKADLELVNLEQIKNELKIAKLESQLEQSQAYFDSELEIKTNKHKQKPR